MQPAFKSFSEFLAMGTHGVFVWSSWLITVVVMLGLIIYSLRQRKNLLKQLANQHARQQQRQVKTRKM